MLISHWRSHRGIAFCVGSVLLAILLLPVSGFALDPDEVLIVANRRVEEGVALATYYARRRRIPKANRLLLDLPDNEVCPRDIYDRKVAAHVRAYLSGGKAARSIRCIVLMYGMPLKVAPGRDWAKGSDRSGPAKIRHDPWASLDSELAVVKCPELPLGGWIANPFCLLFRNHVPVVSKKEVLMVARLDGPTAAGVRRIIDDALRVEASGLSGVAYFDARWPMTADPTSSAYREYDRAIHRAARRVAASGRLRVVVDDHEALFQPGQCPEAALYCGWYSLGRYVDAFDWKPGAVGFHVASSECVTLKNPGSQVWCKRMLENGVCATLGPVGEPYLQAFPDPELFFGLLAEGLLTLAECYQLSLPYLSWKMVLIGDPLYRPFAAGRSSGS